MHTQKLHKEAAAKAEPAVTRQTNEETKDLAVAEV